MNKEDGLDGVTAKSRRFLNIAECPFAPDLLTSQQDAPL